MNNYRAGQSNKKEVIEMNKTKYIVTVALVAGLMATGFSSCCKKQEKDIANLKAQVEQLQKDNTAIKTEADKVKADLDVKFQELTGAKQKLEAENAELKKKLEAAAKKAPAKKKKK